MNLFERTRNKREEDAGLKQKAKSEPAKKETGKTMSQADFSGYGSGRPAQSKKWTDK